MVGETSRTESKRVRQETIETLRGISTGNLSDVLDDMGIRGCMNSEIRPVTRLARRMVGPSLTVKWVPSRRPAADYHTYVHALEAIDGASPGDAYVAAIEGETVPDFKNIAIFGGLMGNAASLKDIAGVVLDSGIRDTEDLEKLNLACFARSVTPFNVEARAETTSWNCPVWCAGVLVNPGDIVVGDRDGVVVIPIEAVDSVISEGKTFFETEKVELHELKKGTSILRVLDRHARI